MSVARRVAVTTASLVAGRVVAVLAGVGSVALASRYLGETGFGTLTLGMSIVAFVALLTDLGLSTMAAREIARAPERAGAIVADVRAVGLAIAVVALAALLLGAQLARTDDDRLAVALLVLGTQVLAGPFVSAARAYFQGVQRGHLIAVGDVALAVVMLIASAVCVAADLGFTAFVAAVGSAYVGQAVAMTALLPAGLRGRLDFDPEGARRLLLLALPLGGTIIVNYLYFRLDVFLLAAIDGKEAVAVYGLAYRVLEGFMVLPAYFMLALFPELARRAADRASIDGMVAAAMRVMELLAVPIVVLVIVFADDIVSLIGGDAYEEGGAVLRILMVALALSYLSGVYGNALPALGRQAAMFRWSLAILGVNLVANLALIPPFGVRGAAVAVVLSEVLALLAVRHLYARGGHAPRLVPDARMLMAGALMAAVVVPCLLLPGGFAGELARMVVGAVLGLSVYAAALVALRAIPEVVVAHLPPRLASLTRST